MPLIQCPECKTDISDKAASCPKCGHPIKASTPSEGKKGVGLVQGLVVSVVLLAVIFFGLQLIKKTTTPVQKPLLPVEVKYRKAILANGYVAIFINTAKQELGVLATFQNPTFKTTKSFRLNLNPGVPLEFGHLQGWNFVSGDKITLQEASYQTWSGNFP